MACLHVAHLVGWKGGSAPATAAVLQRLKVEKITGHQAVRGRGGVIAVMYETHWTGLSGLSWEREIDLQLFRHEILRYWAGTPNQHRQTNRLYRRMRIGAAQRNFLGATASDSWRTVTAAFLGKNGLAATAPRCLPTKPIFGTRATTVCGGLGRSAPARPRRGYIGALFGRLGVDRASSSSGALHDFDRSGTRFLVSTSTLS